MSMGPKNEVRFGVKDFENQHFSTFSLGSEQVTDMGRIKKIDLSELKEEKELISDMPINICTFTSASFHFRSYQGP